MAENLTIESFDYDKIKKESGSTTADSIQTLWYVANNEARERRVGVRLAQERRRGKVVSAAPTTKQNNYDAQGAFTLLFTGSTAFTLTGIRNGMEGDFLLLHNTGSGTITVAHNSTDSDTANRFVMQAGSDKSVAQNKSLLLVYLASRWREVALA